MNFTHNSTGGTYVILAITGASLPILAIGFVGRNRHRLCGDRRARRRSESCSRAHPRFGLRALATVQSLGNFAASAIAGVLWTVVSPEAAFAYAAGWMLIALLAFTATRRRGH